VRTNRLGFLTLSHRGSPEGIVLGMLVILLSSACAGCGRVPPPDASVSPAPVTLHVLHPLGADIGDVMAEIDRRFMTENPGIIVDSESFQLDSYAQALERRLSVSDPLDVVAVGVLQPIEQHVRPDDFLDLSSEPWVQQLTPEGLHTASDRGRTYALPLGKAAIAVAYNKDLFAQLGLAVPTTWPEFVEACRVLETAGIVPLALANGDPWVAQLIPRTMAATAVYGQDADFDAKLIEGKTSFSGSSWREVIADQLSLKASGCFNEDSLKTTYDQSIEMVATGRAAMVVNGTWVAPQIKRGNAALNLGMFPLPYVASGQQVCIPTMITPMLAVPASTRHPLEAKKYLGFLARPDVLPLILTARSELPVMQELAVSLDPATQDVLSQSKTNSCDVFGQSWPIAARTGFLYGIPEVFAGGTTLDAFLAAMDRAFETR
jgi:raffinose/stachyose/melibiose transport system substrate-binding protein